MLTSTIANRLLGEQVIARQWGGLLLGIAGVYLVVQDKATTGGPTPLAWVAALVALLSITFGTIYQKRFGSGIDWRPGMLIQYAAAGILLPLVQWPSRPGLCIGRLNFYSRSAGL